MKIFAQSYSHFYLKIRMNYFYNVEDALLSVSQLT